ncbi:hypothetical protein AVEN_262134-1 [Araneus ventricosus]|uniref:Uncharacterized protein n=1 Tax=Araneus ventricosus TaxID=182803 RepID=A0A4Y2EAZ4_ARAVE|nr:hypothetical protein AVEN_262134-1 [Araneus ventricosus]
MANKLAKIIPFANTKQNLVFDWSSLGLLSSLQTKPGPIKVFILIGVPGSKLDLMVYKTVNFETDLDQEMVKRPQDVSNNKELWGSDLLLHRKSHGGFVQRQTSS